MFTTAYKGFKIQEASNGRFYIDQPQGVFNKDGYPDMNHAKGAVTKYAKQVVAAAIAETSAAPVSERLDAISAIVKASKSATSDDKDFARLPITFKLDNMMAMMRYHGFIDSKGRPRNRATARKSRARIQGPYVGKRNGQHKRVRYMGQRGALFSYTDDYYFANRKAVKSFKMWHRSHAYTVSYGGKIVNK